MVPFHTGIQTKLAVSMRCFFNEDKITCKRQPIDTKKRPIVRVKKDP